jgi:Domain of unknown function (DUF4265)
MKNELDQASYSANSCGIGFMSKGSPSIPEDHVTLFVDLAPSGKPVFEVLPATSLGGKRYKLLGSPGLALGCAAGDIIRCSSDGKFVVEERGGNYCVQAFAGELFSEERLRALADLARQFQAKAEWPTDRRFAVVTFPGNVAIPEVESCLDAWTHQAPNIQWWFSNLE